MKKILVVRFSSIGDIVLTTPVVRCLRQEFPRAEIHYLTKSSYKVLLVQNLYIDKIHTIKKDIGEVIDDLKQENFDFIIDLHHNLRTFRLKLRLHTKSYQFPKVNFKKWLLTVFKINKMPDKHIVDRYFECVNELGVVNDLKGLDYFIPKQDEINLKQYHIPDDFIVFVIGAKFATKRLPTQKIIDIVKQIPHTVVLLGGKEDKNRGREIADACSNVIKLCGDLNLNQSASIIKQAQKVITHDTGLMHIASAFNIPIISIWGNTVPEFGMYPYMPQAPNNYSIHEIKNLKCRPCSKIGYQSCPKSHFKCMTQQNVKEIVKNIKDC
ncbi:MAG TPA: lipopolysaccharide heptosyltransferase family protein [Crocinitomix sp.]|nr:lipopolysaccharide heptosyltransferase family protein [Crocinitomix sp.]